MDADEASVAFSVEATYCLLQLGGSLGVANAEQLRQTAQELSAYRKDIMVDWSRATQMDSAIAQVLLCLRSAVAEHGAVLKSFSVPPPIQAWLASAGLSPELGEVVASA